MDKVEDLKLASTTSSSPNTKQNDCYDDGEHVINQNQLLDNSNKNENVLDLTEGSSVMKNNYFGNCSPQQNEPKNHKGAESERAQHNPVGESQAPVDLSNLAVAKTMSVSEECQVEPFNLKIDAKRSKQTNADNFIVPISNDTFAETPLLDLQTNSTTNSPFEVEQSQDNVPNKTRKETVGDVQTSKKFSSQQESILDLRINNVLEDLESVKVIASNQTYQTRLNEIKVENTLVPQEFAFQNEEEQKLEQSDEITEPIIKLNGSHRILPSENCEIGHKNSKFDENVTLLNEPPTVMKTVEEDDSNVNILKSTLPKNSLSKSAENLNEQKEETFEETNNTESAHELNESRYSSLESLNSNRSASSHQLVIDQAEDEKVAPIRLKLKRKHRKSNSSAEYIQSTKRANIEPISTTNLNQDELNETSNDINSRLATTNGAVFMEEPTTDVPENDTLTEVPANFVAKTPPSYIKTDAEKQLKADVCENLLLDKCLEHVDALKPPASSQYYKCTTCGTYHENWSFFLHLQEKHDRFLCLYCIKCFPTAEKLALHLEIKHDLEQNHFNTEEAFRNSALIIHGFSLETRFLMCCTCQYIFRENAAFTEHACIEFMKSCLLCGQKGRHSNHCKANPLTKRRNKKKIRQKEKPPSPEPPLQIEQTLNLPIPPPSPVLNKLDTPVEQHQPQAQKTSVRRISVDSNSSSNMVIDESCNTNYSLLPNQINPFKALDETERLEKEEAERKKKEEENICAQNLLNSVFKLKLRVPKEFQKPVDEEISTSESEHAEVYEDDAADINSNQVELKNNALEEPTMTATPLLATGLDDGEQNSNIETPFVQSEDESVDDTAANAHLARILQEIEQTKMDIEKTKETLHHRHAEQSNNESNVLTGESTMEGSCAVSDAANKHWTPTPPASPNQNKNPAHLSESEQMLDVPQEIPRSTGEPSQESFPTAENITPIEPLNDSTFNIPIATAPPDDGIEVANEDCLLIELQLDRPLDQFETVEFVRICLKAAYPYCLYCNHARRIAVNAESLVLHLIAQHRFSATVDSITAEELQPSTLVAKLKSFLPELENQFMNSSSYCTMGAGRYSRPFNERIFECFQCRFVTSTHKELYLHNRKMHLRTAILCFMCRCNFYSFSEILCHICPGVQHRVSIFEIKFRCCLCDLTEIPSPFRLMVHLRKRHFACDICLEDCRDQSKLSSHVWKHKLHHLCYRCGIAYRNKLDITKHLFWKHGTESALCKRCLQKRWPHVYHFCVPPAIFSCDICQLCFSKAMYLTVHKRLHQNDFRYACTEANCVEKFISRKLLLKHSQVHELPEVVKDENASDGTELRQKIEETSKSDENTTKPTLVSEASIETETDDVDKVKTESIKEEGTEDQTKEKAKPIDITMNAEELTPPSVTAKTAELNTSIEQPQPNSEKKQKKRKKRAKESLEDLNLIAPNLSESGSSSESESETKSTTATNRQELMLSPLSEHGEQKTQEQAIAEPSAAGNNDGNVLDIWKNFLQAQQQSGELQQQAEYTEDEYPSPKYLHVCMSDHDYCAMFPQKQAEEEDNAQLNAKRESISGQTRNSSSSSEASSEDSSSSSSCCSGSKCSCSSNGSSSSSSSDNSSDSSTVSKKKKRLRKKSEHSNRHRKSLSSSPLKPHQQQQLHNTSVDNVNVIDTDDNVNIALPLLQEEAAQNADEAKTNLEPSFNESDLETAESETDEEYYDEHPQKLATELLSQKRAQLMARTLLSPSHNFDIVENSRPSTPSLPEDMIYEKRQKKKKNKRDRKSTSNSKMLASAAEAEPVIVNELNEYMATALPQCVTMEPLFMPAPMEHFNQNQTNTYVPQHSLEATQPPCLPQKMANHYVPRISEGSSCSDADYSLKRSKRQRRPNKFYGYTSDDESMAPAALGQALVIGTRTYKPLPPPQLVWDKEDLPTPEKSILNSTKKTTRQLSTPNISNSTEHSTKKKRNPTHRKRSGKHLPEGKSLPPIPTLKIRSALINKSTEASDLGLEYSSDSASSEIEQHETPPSRKRAHPPIPTATLLPRHPPNQQLPQHQTAIVAAPVAAAPIHVPSALPPTPQTTAFNHKIPPALLPNPDFSTLQYFKANNIRYPIRPPAGARAAREGESVYCYCRCPYDEVSEMIACDGDSCLIEWFHFECVGIMLAPQGKWFCAECRPQYSEELYPTIDGRTSDKLNLN